ncbi:tripartite tricarboxylate transporter substrate binding protein [Roseateles sp. YR242]|uniref:Bug family tripartite tricarboxylate transporter substrate binding protein n=1 Tax=Roseateles sp. YR242 TaxID=1855305 RepID=UPI0021007388|nr:tripartite tricarboxylate transporter substrate-binding protein [Roseateles sp. YR242]
MSLLTPGFSYAQEKFPTRPITLIVPFSPAGIADNTARTVAEAMAKLLGQPIVVDNRPSAGSIVATQAVAGAKPDGHTLLLLSNSNAVAVGLFKKLPYNTTKDIVPVSTLGFFDLALFAASNSRFATAQQALQFAKAHPGQLKLGTIAVGTTQHLASKLLETVSGAEFLTVPYKSSSAVLMALRSGEIDLALEICGPMLSQLQAGVVKALAVTGTQRNPALPDVPTLQQVGLTTYNVTSWNAIAVPAGTPAPVVQRLNQVIREAVASAAVSSKLEKLGMRLESGSPEQAQKLLVGEIKRWGDVIKAAKIEPE